MTCNQSKSFLALFVLLFQACSNGFLSYGNSYCNPNPDLKANGLDFTAPYWQDIDFRGGNGGFMATIHQSQERSAISVKLFNQTKEYLAKYANVSGFTPTTVILGTWKNAKPYPYYNYIGSKEVRKSYNFAPLES